jgi:hypothetical protein
VLLLDHNRSTGIISLRHYSISVAPSGVSRNLKTLLAHRVPDMGHLQDVAEFLTRSGYGSVSGLLPTATGLPPKLGSAAAPRPVAVDGCPDSGLTWLACALHWAGLHLVLTGGYTACRRARARRRRRGV